MEYEEEQKLAQAILDSEILLSKTLKKTREEILVNFDKKIDKLCDKGTCNESNNCHRNRLNARKSLQGPQGNNKTILRNSTPYLMFHSVTIQFTNPWASHKICQQFPC